jgi:hypothetical protein
MIWTHVSELAIDRMLAGEVPPADAAAMRDHAIGCPRCGALLGDALAVQQAFASARPALRLPVPLAARRPSRRVVLSACTALAAAAAVVLAWPGRQPGGEVRAKGTAIVGFFVAHGNDVRRGETRETVAPGDRIEIFTTTVEPAWFAAVGDDDTGTRSVYVAPRPIEPGRERVLPFSIELDGTLGPETVTGVFCAATFDPRAIDPEMPPAGCTVDRFTLVKVPR